MLFPQNILHYQTLKSLIPHETKNTLFLFDFDGTLSPIITDRNEAKMGASTYSLFQKLSELAITGVLTGRCISDVKHRIPQNIRYLIGEHGLESGFEYIDKNILDLIQKQISDLNAILIDSMKPIKGIEIEKKKYSLTVHYRNSNYQHFSLEDILNNPSILNNFEVKKGDKVFNIFSKNSPNKGTSVVHLFHEFQFDKIFYIGDDLTDEDVFQLKDERLVSIKIGNPKNTKARYNIPLQKEIDKYLEILIDIVSKKF